MLSLRRMFVVGAIAVPLAFGGAGTALADGFYGYDADAGPYGASEDYVLASAHSDHHHHWGFDAVYAEEHSTAGPEGAAVEWVFAVVNENGDVVYHWGLDTAGEQGVSSSSVSAIADY
jgi:hypothetical protein